MALGAIVLLACTEAEPTLNTPNVEITDVAVADLPDAVRSVVVAFRADFQALEIEKKVRDGRTYYDIEGQVEDGSELEFDVLMTETGPEIVEIQRDLDFGNIPQRVQDLALETGGGSVPVRVIESVQTDRTIIYEFFIEGQPADPAYEIRVEDGVPVLLDERWVH
jgi:hypothetical protein